MAPLVRGKRPDVAKRTVKFLTICRNPKVAHEVLRHAPDPVVKALCNISLNAVKGDVQFTPAQRKLFRKHKPAILALSDRSKSIATKRRVLQQRGAGIWIPALAGAITALLGNSLVSSRAS